MFLLDIARMGNEKILHLVQKIQNYRGTQPRKYISEWAMVLVYQQSQIENLQRNVKALCDAHADEGHGHEFNSGLEWPAGSPPDGTGLPVPKLTHGRDFDDFIDWVRARMAHVHHDDLESRSKTLRDRLFHYRDDGRKGVGSLDVHPGTLKVRSEERGRLLVQAGRRYVLENGTIILMGLKEEPSGLAKFVGSNEAVYSHDGRCIDHFALRDDEDFMSEYDIKELAPKLELEDRKVYRLYNGQTMQVYYDSEAKGHMFYNSTKQFAWTANGESAMRWSPTDEPKAWSPYDIVDAKEY